MDESENFTYLCFIMNKALVTVSKVVKGTSTNSDGYSLFLQMDKIICNGDILLLSLHACTPMSSSFLNSSIGALVEKHGFDKMQGRLLLTDYQPSMANNVREYLTNLKELIKAD
jgi:hypothetical protein